jgi:hypothetical protein
MGRRRVSVLMHLVVTVAIAYAIMCWLDQRSIRKDQRRRERQLERELSELERHDGDQPWP